ncbi:FAD-dependent monooxygenase [Nonomuraea indica]|uniref:FAD-dependent monooxygenase n=1 Tax=Nonomuraea indica TaxID=1581193 RepID=UPI001FE8F8E7|nr:FAD-dependent monooxygenase [Nonomuraea indica]
MYEQASASGEVGAGLQLAPNCTRILDRYGLLAEASALGVLPETMVMKDALDAAELTRLDLRDVERRYGHPYLVIHRSDLHGILLRACERAGVELLTDARCTWYENVDGGARVRFADGVVDEADVVIAADGLHSIARELLVQDEPVNSGHVAYRCAVPFEQVAGNDVHDKDVVVYVGPRCHFVQYPLRGAETFNQVAVFESPKALAGQDDWGTPDELDAAFAGTCAQVQQGLPLMWRDRWRRMFDRDPIVTWVTGRIALLGDAAHPPLQYMAQGAIMAIERDVHDYSFVDWIFGPTALTPEDEPEMFRPIPWTPPRCEPLPARKAGRTSGLAGQGVPRGVQRSRAQHRDEGDHDLFLKLGPLA